MDFRLLGPLEVVDGGLRVDLGGSRQQRVLAVLLVRRGRAVSADSLIDEVWGEAPPASAATSLQIAVSKLRKLLGADRIQTQRGSYLLQADEAEVDAARFARAVRDAASLRARGLTAESARLLRDGLGLWRGEVLSGLHGGELLVAEAARLEEMRLGALEDAAEAQLGLGLHAEVVGELRGLVDAHPYRERLHAQLILALYRCGRQTEALAAFARVRALLADELGIDPSPELAVLEQQILRQEDQLAGPATRTPLPSYPVPPTELVGREQELAELEKSLAEGTRLLTVTGPGGVGKTRLVLSLAQGLSAGELGYHGVFVDLSALSDPELVLPTIANALGILENASRPLLEIMIEALAPRRLLLLLDNVEQVIDASPQLAGLLSRCPELRLVVTSRERLALRGEKEYALAPLPGPGLGVDDVADIASYPAVQLFCERVRAVQPDFALDAANAGIVAELCRLLDGLPLALELAAARVKLLSPSALVARLRTDRGVVLSGGARDLPVRHRALDATIAWSYDGLTEAEQHVARVCSVFAGGATFEAVEAVCGSVPGDALQHLSSLVDKSLLLSRPDPDGQPRIAVLETVRSFAADRLEECGATEEVHERHLAYYAQLVSGARLGLWSDHDRWMSQLDAELDNVRAAMEWAFRRGDGRGAQVIADLGMYWRYRGALAEGKRWLTQAVAVTTADTAVGAQARVHLAEIEFRHGEFSGWARHLPEALAQLQAVGDVPAHAAGMSLWSDCLWRQGQHQEAVQASETAVFEARQVGLPLLLCLPLALLGVFVAQLGDLERGLEVLSEASGLIPPEGPRYFQLIIETNLSWVEIQAGRHAAARDRLLAILDPRGAEGVDDQHLSEQSAIRTNLGWARLGAGEAPAAVALFLEGVHLAERLGDMGLLPEVLAGLGCAAERCGLTTLAGLSFGLASSLAQEMALVLDSYVADREAEAKARMDPVLLARDLDAGRALSPAELVATARSVLVG